MRPFSADLTRAAPIHSRIVFWPKIRFFTSIYVTILPIWTLSWVVPQTSWQCWIRAPYEPCDFSLRKLPVFLISFPGTPGVT